MAESDSKSSSDETDRSDQNVDLGPGRSYECAFCKRGFTTAQALGGHMNIHRKDRRKPIIRPDYTVNNHPLVSSKSVDHQENNYTSFRSFVAIQSYPPVHFSRSSDPDHHHHHQVHLKPYQTYINPATTNWGTPTTATPVLQDHDNPNYNDMLRRNWRGSSILSLGIGMSHREQDDQEDDDHDKGTISGDLHSGDHAEVDLELRLGYDP